MKMKNNWDTDILEIEEFFSINNIPKHPVKLNDFTTIEDTELFVKSHLDSIKINNGNETFIGDLNRLKLFIQIIKSNNEKTN